MKKRHLFLIIGLSFVFSSCAETPIEHETPVYKEDRYPQFSTGIMIKDSGSFNAPSLVSASSFRLDLMSRSKIENITKQLTYKLTPKAVSDVFENNPYLSPPSKKYNLTLEQKDYLLLHAPDNYQRFNELQDQMVELEVALDEIAGIYGKEKDDRLLFSSLDYFKTYISYLAVHLEMERIIYGNN